MKQINFKHHNHEGIFHTSGQGHAELCTPLGKMSHQTLKLGIKANSAPKNCGNISQYETIPTGKMSKVGKTCKIPSQSSTLSENQQTQIPYTPESIAAARKIK